jgi:DNA-binding transcriptional LysR family regulator
VSLPAEGAKLREYLPSYGKGRLAAALRPCVNAMSASGACCGVGSQALIVLTRWLYPNQVFYANQVSTSLERALVSRQHGGSGLPTVVTAIPGARFPPRGPRCVIGLRVVRISRLPVLARAARTGIGIVRVEELIVRGYGRPVHLVRVVFGRRVHFIGCRGHLIRRPGNQQRPEND